MSRQILITSAAVMAAAHCLAAEGQGTGPDRVLVTGKAEIQDGDTLMIGPIVFRLEALMRRRSDKTVPGRAVGPGLADQMPLTTWPISPMASRPHVLPTIGTAMAGSSPDALLTRSISRQR